MCDLSGDIFISVLNSYLSLVQTKIIQHPIIICKYRERLGKSLDSAGVFLSVGIQRQVAHGTFGIIAADL